MHSVAVAQQTGLVGVGLPVSMGASFHMCGDNSENSLNKML